MSSPLIVISPQFEYVAGIIEGSAVSVISPITVIVAGVAGVATALASTSAVRSDASSTAMKSSVKSSSLTEISKRFALPASNTVLAFSTVAHFPSVRCTRTTRSSTVVGRTVIYALVTAPSVASNAGAVAKLATIVLVPSVEA